MQLYYPSFTLNHWSALYLPQQRGKMLIFIGFYLVIK